jgi:hypothetical protein
MDAKPGVYRWRQGRCLPYGEGITFWALGEIVKAEAGILESDSADIAAAKLDRALSPEQRDRQWLLQRLAPLVGAEAASPAERQEAFTAWRRFVEALAAARPTVLVFDDLHWADAALLDFLEYLAEWSQDVPLLLVCAARPELYERQPGWGAGQRNAQTINLAPLSDRETADLVSYLSRRTVLTPDLEQAVVKRAGGNPLYAEEFARLLADRGLDTAADLTDKVTLPESVQALIAARLDTLSTERKRLLQDAAVVGKLFWVGALAAMGERGEAELELALHELTRKELVRSSRTSSMEGESEYSFWHLLVRDVAYAQIPRAERARRHRAAAVWIERKAGERVEDVADLLAHHYLQALELAQAAGDAAQSGELAAPARRFLALAGGRALGLDTAQAEARLARALALTPPDDPDRLPLLVTWSQAAFQAGRPLEAADALDKALASVRTQGMSEVTARALQLRSRVALRLGEGTQVDLAMQAVALLEREAYGTSLIEAYAQLAHVRVRAGAYSDAITAADRARAVAAELGVSEPARALAYRGEAEAYLGNPDGLAQMEWALGLLVEQGAGWDAAAVLNNIAIARYPLEGPANSLAAFEEARRFCEERGLYEMAAGIEGNCPLLLAELGRTGEALERAAAASAALEASGTTQLVVEARASHLAIRVACGERHDRSESEWLVATAHAVRAADIMLLALSVSAAAELARGDAERPQILLAELERSAGTRETPYYARQLAAMVRTALAAGDGELAGRLVDRLEPHYPLDRHALRAARAQLAEHAGNLADAAQLYGEAAASWATFGNVPERAYALLGDGRCLRALGDAEAAERLGEAQTLFASIGYAPALAATEALLGEGTGGPAP